MKHFLFITTIVLTMFNNVLVLANDTSIPIYLGTYTRGEGGAKGIYLTRLHLQDGRLTEPQLVAEVPNPAFLAKHPTLPRLYAVSEGGQSHGSPVYAFSIDPATNALTKLNEQSVPARGACHLGVFPLPNKINEPKKYAVMVAYYSDGAVASLPLTADGRLAPYVTIHKQRGSGPTPRQQQAHAHAVYPIWKPWVVVVPDLGADKLFFYAIHSDGKLASYGELGLPPGSGPRHAAFLARAQTAFILNELNSTICVAACTGSNVSPTVMKIEQTISTLPQGHSAENNTTAAIFLHPNERFLYASNRGDDSIALFHFDTEKRRLEFIETVPSGGRHPRSFDISPDGQWLIVAAMHDHKITTFRIDPNTGQLSPTGQSISVPQPACVLPIAPTDVSDLTTVRALRLDQTETTDADLARITIEYPNLVELTLSETSITNAGLAPLTTLTKLRKIRLSKTAITDDAAKILAQIPTLEDIDVSQTLFGDNGLKTLQPLGKLKRLNLYRTKITDKGLTGLKDFPSRQTLVWLNVDRCSLTDEAIPLLFPLENLEWLHLGWTRLTDAGLAKLAGLQTLKEIFITHTNVTLDGITKFKSVLPECKVNENVGETSHVAP